MTDPTTTDAPPPAWPTAAREPKDVTVHGDARVDDWWWLRQRDDPRTLPALEAENAYAEAWFAPHAGLVAALRAEMESRIQPDDDSVPYRKGAWWYRMRVQAGEQYPRFVRSAAAGPERRFDPDAPEATLLDLNAEAGDGAFLSLGAVALSRDATRLAYTLDRTGGRDYVLAVRELGTGATLAWALPEVASIAWGADRRTLFAVTMDAQKRSHRLWRCDVEGGAEPELLLDEPDELYSVDVGTSRDERYAVVSIGSMDTTEVRVLDLAAPGAALRTAFPRREGVEIDLDHRDGRFVVRLNDTGRNFRLIDLPAEDAPDLARARELVAAREDAMLDGLDVFARHTVVAERADGALGLRVIDAADPTRQRVIATGDPTATVHTAENAEFDTGTLRYVLTSLTTPPSTIDEDLATGARTVRKVQPVPGYDASLYASERVHATAADGTRIPVSLVWRKDRRAAAPGPQPLLLYGYGAYGIPNDPEFRQTRVSLLDRGVVFALAHVRGGGDLGRTWYEAGKMEHKHRSFSDFVACAEHLVATGRTARDRLAAQGGSAGGLLMGAAINLDRSLWRAVVLQVPFVDVVNTMLDETLPLTVGEYVEWGNPQVESEYRWLRAYSPYDNLAAGDYPAMLVRTGINDTQVQYWEPAKYVAKLRTLKANERERPLLFRIDLEVGHGGKSGRFHALQEVAENQAFVLVELGVG
jgi:oligopeptidase B